MLLMHRVVQLRNGTTYKRSAIRNLEIARQVSVRSRSVGVMSLTGSPGPRCARGHPGRSSPLSRTQGDATRTRGRSLVAPVPPTIAAGLAGSLVVQNTKSHTALAGLRNGAAYERSATRDLSVTRHVSVCLLCRHDMLLTGLPRPWTRRPLVRDAGNGAYVLETAAPIGRRPGPHAEDGDACPCGEGHRATSVATFPSRRTGPKLAHAPNARGRRTSQRSIHQPNALSL